MSYEQLQEELNLHEREYRELRAHFLEDGEIDPDIEQPELDRIENTMVQIRQFLNAHLTAAEEGRCVDPSRNGAREVVSECIDPGQAPQSENGQGPSPDRSPSRNATSPPEPRVSEATRNRDIEEIMSLVQEVHVSDDEENRILEIFEHHAQDQASFEAFLNAVNRRHTWGGLFNERYRPLLASVLNELEDGRGVRVRELLNRSQQERYRNYEPPEEISFAESFEQDRASGQIGRQVVAYFQGMGDAGVAMAESIELLVTNPQAFAEGIGRLPETAQAFWENRGELWQSFLAAEPEEQARMIGRITGEIELFLATEGAGRGLGAGQAGTVPALAPAAAVQMMRGGQAALRGAPAINVAALGPRAAQAAQMAAHTAQLQGASRATQDAAEAADSAAPAARSGGGGGAGGGGSGRVPPEGGNTPPSGRPPGSDAAPRTPRTETVGEFTARGGEIQRVPSRRPRSNEITAHPTQESRRIAEQARAGDVPTRDPIIEDPALSTDLLRRTPGRVTGGERLRTINSNWFADGRIAPVPGQIASRLRAIGDFQSFAEFRQMFWQLVAEDTRLAPPGGWHPSNLTLMRNGHPPRVISGQATGGGSNAVMQLNHRRALEHGGDVFDLDNLEIVTPRMHGDMRM